MKIKNKINQLPGIGPLNNSNFSESSNCVTTFEKLRNCLGKILRDMVSKSMLDKDLKHLN